jgi:hypothetical protein
MTDIGETPMFSKDPADKKQPQDSGRPVLEDAPCVWMQAGVTNFKLCNHASDCSNCPFDEATTLAWNGADDVEKP